MTDPVLGDLAPRGRAGAVPTVPDRQPARRQLSRSALFNWAFARHYGGTLVLRIEDTDLARNTPRGLASALRLAGWLGIDYDEGPGVGGEFGPYKQSERFDIYRDIVARLRESGAAYDCYCTNEEVDARRKASGSKVQGYDGFCRDLTDEQVAAFEAEGRTHVVRFRIPDRPITFDDLVRGEVTFQPEHVPDFAIVARQRRPALHAGQPGRRRADGDHPRAARRGPALLDAAPDRALRGARAARHRHRLAAVRPPAHRDGGGQQAALQARRRAPASRSTSSAASCPQGCSTTSPCWAGGSRRTATCSRWRRWPRPSTSAGSTPTPRGSTSRSSRRSTPRTCGCSASRSSSVGWCRSSSEADLDRGPADPGGDPQDHRGQCADPRARRHPRRGRGHAGVPVPRRGRVRRDRRRQGSRRRGSEGRGRCARRPGRGR